ncbi:MAG: hypothetical protein IPN76_20475 [Saprospiraceae bacterium]|nr:hypothetical protein [Saprospiraceae bacterium]
MKILICLSITFFFLMSIVGCKVCGTSSSNSKKYQNADFSPYCQELVEKIILPHWHIDRETKLYNGSKEYWEQAILWNQYCFIGRSKSQIESVFGNPTKEWKYRKSGGMGTYYSINNDGKSPPWNINFIYGSDERVSRITDIMSVSDE